MENLSARCHRIGYRHAYHGRSGDGEEIREVDGDTIILFTTGLTSPKDLKAGYAAGANNYVKKPFIPEELDAHIQSLMRLKEGKRSKNNSQLVKLGKYILDANHATLKTRRTTARRC